MNAKLGGFLIRLLTLVTAVTVGLIGLAPASSAYPFPYEPPGPPSAPTGVRINVDNLCIQSMWEAPADDGGSSVTSYTLEVRPAGLRSTQSNPANRYGAVCGLAYDTDYELVIYATNTFGTGPASEPKPFRIPSPPPQNPVAVTNMSSALIVSWQKPTSGTPVGGYRVTANPGGKTLTTSESQVWFSALDLPSPDTYSFTVEAIDAAGAATTLGVSQGVYFDPPIDPQHEVATDVKAVAGPESATVTWTPPLRTHSPVLNYYVEATPGGQYVSAPKDATTATVTGLTAGTSYTFVVHAYTGSAGPASAPSNAVIPFAAPPPPPPITRPGVPLDVTAAPGDGSATLTWQPPSDDGNSPITGYEIRDHYSDAIVARVDASTRRFTLSGLRNGEPYRFSVAARNSEGLGTWSPSVAVTPFVDLRQLTPATVTGTLQVGKTITAHPGTWSHTPERISYMWSRVAADGTKTVLFTTSPSYTLTASDVGHRIEAGMEVAYPQAPTRQVWVTTGTIAPAQQVIGTPTFSATPKVGKRLHGTVGGADPATLSYQWRRVSSTGTVTTIVGATASSYVPVAADRGQRLNLRVTAARPGYQTVIKTRTTATVLPGTLVTSTPRFSGSPKVGRALTASPGTWKPTPTLRYQWYRISSTGRATTITGATRATYVPTAGDRWYRLRVKVTGSRSGYTTASRTATTSGAVAAGTFLTATPKISGTPKVARTLTAYAGTWKPTPTLRYQWYRVTTTGKVTTIKGATSRSYKATSLDRGRKLRVKITGSRSGYSSVSRTVTTTRTVAR